MSRLEPMNYEEMVSLDRMQDLLRGVGQYQCQQFRKLPAGRGDEKLLREFVSEVDIRSENRLRKKLHQILPEAAFHGEETEQERSEGLTWIVDPLDGTTNFLSGFEWWCISVGLSFGQNPVAGFVYRPYTGDLFHAFQGRGAYFNGKRLAPVVSMPLRNALIVTGFPYRSPNTATSFYACAESILRKSRGIRRIGSAALELCYIAAGNFQGFWEVDLQAYDVAAALVVLSECGCLFSDFKGQDYRLFESDSITVGVPGVFEALITYTSVHYAQPVSEV